MLNGNAEKNQKHKTRCKTKVHEQQSLSVDDASLVVEQTCVDNVKSLYQCDKCSNKYKSKQGLRKHQWRHSGIGLHMCNMCNKQFTAPSKLESHMLIHSQEKPHKCNLCNKEFNEKGTFKNTCTPIQTISLINVLSVVRPIYNQSA